MRVQFIMSFSQSCKKEKTLKKSFKRLKCVSFI